ncbi:hypothetical protein WUBG_07540 [Wuchereria bancrofti]|uniref:Cullin N-terminal domain-containing protein n=1 Tax=Wuchereria bancrofti TaxID=6293 RepID=J9B3L6_WUCBA|nr:hypothetical protein WUBG_07540 [Wuchereria bancrofti]
MRTVRVVMINDGELFEIIRPGRSVVPLYSLFNIGDCLRRKMLRGPANPVDFDKEWTEAKSTVISLLNQRGVSKVQWQELFAIVYRICTWIEDGGDMVRKELEAEVHRYIVAAERRIMQHEEEKCNFKGLYLRVGKILHTN